MVSLWKGCNFWVQRTKTRVWLAIGTSYAWQCKFYITRKLLPVQGRCVGKRQLGINLHLMIPGQAKSVERSRYQRQQYRLKTTVWSMQSMRSHLMKWSFMAVHSTPSQTKPFERWAKSRILTSQSLLGRMEQQRMCTLTWNLGPLQYLRLFSIYKIHFGPKPWILFCTLSHFPKGYLSWSTT